MYLGAAQREQRRAGRERKGATAFGCGAPSQSRGAAGAPGLQLRSSAPTSAPGFVSPHRAPERGGSGSFENPLTLVMTRLGEAASPCSTL